MRAGLNAIQYGVRRSDNLIDIDEVKDLAIKHKPQLIIAGGSAYPRHINFSEFREIADLVGAYLLVDMAHFSGLVAGHSHPSPFPHAHIATTTTHKVLRGPRGGLILTNDEDISKKISNSNQPLIIFPQGTRVLPDERPPFKKGASRIYEELKITCQPVAINSGYVWPKKGYKNSNKVITISILKPIMAGHSKEEFIKILENNIYEELNLLN